MTGYMPLLMGKTWELNALENLSPPARQQILPLFEILANADDEKHPLRILRKCMAKKLAALPRVAIDLSRLPYDSDPENSLVGLATSGHLSHGPSILPVVRLDSSPILLADARATCGLQRTGAVLRVPTDPYAKWPARELTERAREILRSLELRPDQAYLLVDAKAVTDADSRDRAAEALLRVLLALIPLPWRMPFAGAGAFPTIPPQPNGSRKPRPARRYDADVWWHLLSQQPMLTCGFADYAMNHPGRRPEGRTESKPPPFLSYTVGPMWNLRTYERREPGNSGFFDLCEDLVRSEDWHFHHSDPMELEEAEPDLSDRRFIERAATVSWGDGELARCALGLRASGKAGGPTDWLGWGLSHHLEVVARSVR